MSKEKKHPLLIEMDMVGPKCNWKRHDGAYTEEDKMAQEEFFRLGSQYYNDPTIPGTQEEKSENILKVRI